MAASAVPLAGDGLGVEGSDHALLLADAVKQEAGDVEVITGLDTGAGADLEFGLDFSLPEHQKALPLSAEGKMSWKSLEFSHEF